MALGGIVGVRHRVGARAVRRLPLMRPGRALRQFPFEAEQILEEVVAPLRRRRRPGDLETTGDGIVPLARAELALPAEALFLEACGFRLRPHQRRIAGAVRLAEGVAAGNQSDRLLVVHGHAREGLSNVPGGGKRIRLAVRAFRIDVDQAHLDGGEGILEVPVARVALVAEPGLLLAPVDILLGLPDVNTPAAVAEGLEAHRFERAISREDHQVGPGDLLAVLALDRPQQAARLVEVGVVGPAVERREPLRSGGRPAAAIAGAVGAGAVPRHANEERAVVTEVGRPPFLRFGHQGEEVLLHLGKIELLEGGGVVEVLLQRVGQGGVLVEDPEVELVRPPVSVRTAGKSRIGTGPMHYRALAAVAGLLVIHVFLSCRGRLAGTARWAETMRVPEDNSISSPIFPISV